MSLSTCSSLRLQEQIVEAVKGVFDVQQRAVEQLAGVSVPQILEETAEVAHIAEVIQLFPQERIPVCIAEQEMDLPGPQNQEHIVGGVQGIPKERVRQRTGEPNVDVPVSLGEVIPQAPTI